CLPDSRGAGAGRLPPLLGLPSGRTKWPLTWPYAAHRRHVPKRRTAAIPNPLVFFTLNDYYSQKSRYLFSFTRLQWS
ncbi:hypothetical protein, partial [Duffyella sp. Ts4]|uniref:hypothetical protein n=1 Tax=Duffyella sp. Ts4 TaxID=3402768 RepID=UPI003F704C7A